MRIHIVLLVFIAIDVIKIENNSFWYFNFLNQWVAFEIGIGLYHIEKANNIGRKSILIFASLFTAITVYLFYWSKTSYAWLILPLTASLAAAAWFLYLKDFKIKYGANLLKNISNATLSIFIIHPFLAYYGISYSYKILEKVGFYINGVVMLLICLPVCFAFSYLFALKLEPIFAIPLKWYKKVSAQKYGQNF